MSHILKNKTMGRKNTLPGGSKRAFSLMEVSVALLVVGVGFSALLQLLPFGLRESKTAVDDSAQAVFAQMVFSTVRSRAMRITSWSEWKRESNFTDLPKVSIEEFGYEYEFNKPAYMDAAEHLGIRSYYIETRRDENDRILRMTVWSTPFDTSTLSDDEAEMDLIKSGAAFYTEFMFMPR